MAGFNGVSSSFEFVDVGTRSEGVFDKIGGMASRLLWQHCSNTL